MTALLMLLLVAAAVRLWWRRGRPTVARRPDIASDWQAPALPTRWAVRPRPPAALAPGVRLSEAALAYERAFLELSAVSEQAKGRALAGLAGAIVPLVGQLALDEVTEALESGVAAVLAEEAAPGEEWIVYIWHDFVRWSRFHFATWRSFTLP